MGETDSTKLGLVLMGAAMLHKSLIQFSVEGQGCVPSLLFDLGPNCGGDNEDDGGLLQKAPYMHCCTQCPQPSSVIVLSQLKLLFRAKRMCSGCMYEDLKNRQSWSMLRGQDTLYLAKSNT